MGMIGTALTCNDSDYNNYDKKSPKVISEGAATLQTPLWLQ